MTGWVDVDLAFDKTSCHSVTSTATMINGLLFKTFSKRQVTEKSSTNGFDLMARKIATEQVIALRYLLRSLGVKIEGPTLMSVVT